MSPAAEGAGHATLHAWRVPGPRLPRVLWRMARDPRRLRGLPGVTFAKLLGTGRGRGFDPGQIDLSRWVAVLSWTDAAAAAGFEDTAVARAWARLAQGYCRIDLSPRTSRGRWAGCTPFRVPADPRPAPGPVLALTRARLRPGRAVSFWRAVGPVAATARAAPGLLATLGVGEAPLGYQGTVSVWRTERDLVEFAYRQPQHRRAIAAAPARRWYAEELFARFAVIAVTGDRSVLGWDGVEDLVEEEP